MRTIHRVGFVCFVLLFAACSEVRVSTEQGVGDAAGGDPLDGGWAESDAGPTHDGGAVDDVGASDTAGDAGATSDTTPADAGRDDVGDRDAGATDTDVPDVDAPPEPRLDTCTYRGTPGIHWVNTHSSDVPRVTLAIDGVPDPAAFTEASLVYLGHDMDHPGDEGFLRINGGTPAPLQADESLDNRDREFRVDVLGQVRAGRNDIEFFAIAPPGVSHFSVTNLRFEITGWDLGCTPPEPIEGPMPTPAPLGISAFAALSPYFPAAETIEVLAQLSHPFTTVLLDFGPAYDPSGVQMFAAGELGSRDPNPAHFEALVAFVERLVAGTPDATERHVQLYLLNGPGIRRSGYPRAFDVGQETLDGRVQSHDPTRADLLRYLRALDAALEPHRDDVTFRLAVGLEDNFTTGGAQAVHDLARNAGWDDAIGRNPCGCGYGDTARVGSFHEAHLHSLGRVDALPGDLRAPDAFSNDGWGFTYDSAFSGADAVRMIARAAETGLWYHLWYDPSQGYPVPDRGPRDYRFDHPTEQVIGWFEDGLGVDRDPATGPTGDGIERTMGYREAVYEQRHNWVLDCYDYAYSAQSDDHLHCDALYDPDGTTHGRAIFTFADVIADRYEVWIEGRHTENRSRACMLTLVNGAEARICQRDDRNMVWDLHGTHDLSGTVEVIIDSSRDYGSDSVRRVRLTPVP